ncbi:MAG: membrane protein insertion efficiency factor YidD [Candidatus Auribacterota bacterium]|jgi:putative membrane protein insertion efficiency factor
MLKKIPVLTVLALIKGYQTLISGAVPRCRYLPTCSQYAAEAVRVHGLLKGLALSLKRIGRCNPFGGYGYDPVPPLQNKRKK